MDVRSGASGGSSASAITTMPAVVPSPMSSDERGVVGDAAHGQVDPSATRGSARNTAMTTTLLSIGANAAASEATHAR